MLTASNACLGAAIGATIGGMIVCLFNLSPIAPAIMCITYLIAYIVCKLIGQ